MDRDDQQPRWNPWATPPRGGPPNMPILHPPGNPDDASIKLAISLILANSDGKMTISDAANVYITSLSHLHLDERSLEELIAYLNPVLSQGEHQTIEHCYILMENGLRQLSHCELSTKWNNNIVAAVLPVFDHIIAAIRRLLETSDARPKLNYLASLCELSLQRIWQHIDRFRETPIDPRLELLVKLIPIVDANIISLYQLASILPNDNSSMKLLAHAINNRILKEKMPPGLSHKVTRELCEMLNCLLNDRHLSTREIAPVIDAITCWCQHMIPRVERGEYPSSYSVNYLLRAGLPTPLLSVLRRPQMSDARAKTAVPPPSDRFSQVLDGVLNFVGFAGQLALHAVPNSVIHTKVTGHTLTTCLGKRRHVPTTSPSVAADEDADKDEPSSKRRIYVWPPL